MIFDNTVVSGSVLKKERERERKDQVKMETEI